MTTSLLAARANSSAPSAMFHLNRSLPCPGRLRHRRTPCQELAEWILMVGLLARSVRWRKRSVRPLRVVASISARYFSPIGRIHPHRADETLNTTNPPPELRISC